MTEQFQKQIHDLLDLKNEFIKASREKSHTVLYGDRIDDLTNAAAIGQALDFLSHGKLSDAIDTLKDVQEHYNAMAWVERTNSTSWGTSKNAKQAHTKSAEKYEANEKVIQNIRDYIASQESGAHLKGAATKQKPPSPFKL